MWQHFSVAAESHRPSAEDLWEAREAGRRLRLLAVYERLAQRAESPSSTVVHDALVERYREAVGVVPQERQAFRAAMERIVAGGGGSVLDLIEGFHAKYQANGSGAGDALGFESRELS